MPRSAAKPDARSTSRPVWTGSVFGFAGADPDAPKSRPVIGRVRPASAGASVRAAAAIVATLARSGVTSPLPSGCTRFDRNTTNSRVAGSIQIDVPVNPVWPKEPTGNSSPRFCE